MRDIRPRFRCGLGRSKWFLPLFAVALGVMMLIAQSIGGHPDQGVVSLVIMAAFGLLVLLGGRSETVRGFRGDGVDERFAEMNLRATATAGQVVILAVIVAFVVEVVRGHSGEPFDWIGAIAGLSYMAAIVWQRVRA